MPGRRDRHRKIGEDLERVSGHHDLRLDPGGSEEQIQYDAGFILPTWDQPRARQTAGGLLFDDGRDAIATALKFTHEPLSVRVPDNADGEIDVAGEARLGPGRHRQGAHESPAVAKFGQVGCGAAENDFEPAQRSRRDQVIGLPGASPASAPGRVCSQAIR